MGESVLRVTFPFHKQCDICHKPMKSLYKIDLDGYSVYVCTGAEAVIARDRWMAKKEGGITPQQTQSEDSQIMDDGNIPEDE
jgi:hypothetical protein